MNWLDIMLLIFLVPSVLVGWKFGLIRSLFGLIALIVGIILASRFYSPLAVDILDRVFQPTISMVLSFFLIFIFVIVAIGIVIRRLDKLVTASILNWVNKLGGAAFGMLFGAIILGALLAIILKFFGDQPAITESTFASILVDKFPVVLSLLPNEFNAIRSFFN